MDRTFVEFSPYLRISDAISPEAMAEKLGRQGIQVSAAHLTQKALELGACRLLGEALFLLPEDVDAILRHGKQTPAPVADQPEKSKARAQRQVIEPDRGQARNVYTPPMLAKRWRCSERHVRNLINEGKVGCFRLGGKLIRIRHSDVEAAEKTFSEDGHLSDKPDPRKHPANEVMTIARVNAVRAKRLDR